MVEATKVTQHEKKANSGSAKKSPVRAKEGKESSSLSAHVDQFLLKLSKDQPFNEKGTEGIPEKEKRCLLEIKGLKDADWHPLPEPPSKYALDASMWVQVLKWSQNPILALQLWGENPTNQQLKLIISLIKQHPEKVERIFDATGKPSILPKRKRVSLANELSDALDVSTLPPTAVLEILKYLVSNNQEIGSHLLKLDHLDDAFNSLDDNNQAKFMMALKRNNFHDFLMFFSRLEISKVRIALLKEIRASITNSEVQDFYVWKNPTSKFSTAGIETKIIKASVEEKLKLSNALPELLSIWPIIANPDNGYELVKFQEKFQSEMVRDTQLAISLRNPELGKLKAANVELAESVRLLKDNLDRAEGSNKRLTESLDEAKSDIVALRARITEISKGDQVGLEARDNQVKIDLLRDLLPAFHRAIEVQEDEILKILEKANVERIGRAGAKIPWNPNTCESLTGEVSEQVEVIEPGFTWFNGNQTVILKRILVKSL